MESEKLTRHIFVPASVARRRVGKMVDKVSSSPTAFIITRYKKASAVVLGVDQYNHLFPKGRIVLPSAKPKTRG
jgi:hypothetical protein